VVPLPGASAVTAAVAASGLAGPRWSFEGFLPRSGAERRARLGRIAADERATILFEAPDRVAATLDDVAEACGSERPAALCRELTKVHEQIVRGSLGWLAGEVREGRVPARGEHVIVVGAWPAARAGAQGDARQRAPAAEGLVAARAQVEALAAGGMSRREAASRVAAETGLPSRELYRPGG
jgi:16S rRNA (cytidine1402-2'-O)-methyltransferase